MSALAAFFAAHGGGYGAFIWPAYAVSALGLGGATIWTLLRWRKAKARLAALEKP
jgi:heme exporter protein CcmD